MRLIACYLVVVTLFSVAVASGQVLQSNAGPIAGKTAADSRTAPDRDLVEGKVIRVLDGDTIRIKIHNRTIHSVRLQGIDAPEGAQEDAERARKALSEMILGENVKVVAHKSDQNGMIIGTVYLRGRDVGLAQIESGYAWHYKHFAYEQTAANRKTYAQSEAKAKTDKTGLWARSNPVPPWEFRDGKKEPEIREIKSAPTAVVPPATNAPVNNSPERKYILGPRGGCYYVSSSGSKVYVSDKSLCSAQPVGVKP